ncbi:Eukaryotic translation initiation factor 3 subunit I [Bulinus truncatus]|nr:Eukaryotic translation initiation factor 3 subunit I [Bulinus truncatus]
MKPIMLHGHERSITQIKYNREGDLIFSCAKDPQPNVWYSLNGERLGTFVGHNGAVWCIDCSWDTSKVLTGAADNFCKLWDCETGKQLNSLETRTAVRTNGFSYSGNLIMFTTDKTMGCACEIHIYDIRDGGQLESNTPLMTIPIESSQTKITSAIWGPYEESIITGHENGEIQIFDVKTSKKQAISPLHDHVVLGGGQEAMQVTTTSTRVGKFDARFFHLIFEEEFGRVKGHFGPINSVAFHPDGKSYSSGGEDGYVRVHYFDSNYLDMSFEY